MSRSSCDTACCSSVIVLKDCGQLQCGTLRNNVSCGVSFVRAGWHMLDATGCGYHSCRPGGVTRDRAGGAVQHPGVLSGDYARRTVVVSRLVCQHRSTRASWKSCNARCRGHQNLHGCCRRVEPPLECGRCQLSPRDRLRMPCRGGSVR
jgi:hypothetical protein